MIIQLSGGLGNQLFQYALGRKIEIMYGIKVKYDVFLYRYDLVREYGLKYYNTTILECNIVSSLFYNIVKKLKFDRCFGVHSEKNLFEFERIRINKKYLIGVWQNIRYFEDIKKILMKEIAYKYDLTADQKALKEQIINTKSVAVHVRRGDYLQLESLYYVQEINYYKRAMDFFYKKYDNIVFYIFSDDIEWCKKNLSENKHFIYVDSKISGSPYIDFELMKHCKNFIISNSTFSWWASWLAEAEGKEMIAPAKWFKNEHDQKYVVSALLKEYILM